MVSRSRRPQPKKIQTAAVNWLGWAALIACLLAAAMLIAAVRG